MKKEELHRCYPVSHGSGAGLCIEHSLGTALANSETDPELLKLELLKILKSLLLDAYPRLSVVKEEGNDRHLPYHECKG